VKCMAVSLHYSLQMQSFSHCEPINNSGELTGPDVVLLADAFSEFISASGRLEASYEKLQLDVMYLSQELADRNSALKFSLEENERVHLALRQIVDAMPCGVLVVEEDGVVPMMNPEGRRLLGLGSSTAKCLNTISVEAGIDLAGFLKWPASCGTEQEFCTSLPRARRWLAIQQQPLLRAEGLGQQGRVGKQTVLILRDVTSHKLAEEERERARRATALAEVATTLAHEIRNPLASLELFAGLIASGGEDTAEWISHLHAGIRSLAGTVNNVLSFHGVGFPALCALDLADTIRSSVEFVRPIAKEAGVTLSFSSDLSKVEVQGNSGALQQVVLNMVSNAIRHTGKGGSVQVSVRQVRAGAVAGAGLAVIEFADTGSGIAADHLQEIFRPGFSGSGNSSGLGLSVCQQIVKQHEGQISVASTPGLGSTFSVEIPTL